MSRKQESGQVFVLAALSMMVLIAIAAFCVNASYMFYQHERMQAQVDEQTRLAAGSGCIINTSTLDGGTLAITPTTFFGQEGSYCDGVLTKQAGGLFGSILRFPNKISVHAVAQHGGSTEVPFTFLGLSPCGTNYPNCKGNSSDCSVSMNGGSALSVYSKVLANSSLTYSDCESNNTTLGPGNPYVSPANMLDPYQVTEPVSGTVVRHCTSLGSGCAIDTTCLTGVPSGATDYYQPSSLTNKKAVASVSTVGTSNNQRAVYLPYCQGSSTKMPGIYLISTDMNQTGGETDVISSTMVLSTSVTSLSVNGGTINWSSPDTGMFKGYILYQETYSNETCASIANAKINGNIVAILSGLIDLSCSNLDFSGGSGSSLDASFVGWTITFGGNGTGANVHKPDTFAARGAFLTQ